MDHRRSRSIESPRRGRNGAPNRRDYRRYSRSRSRSRERNRDHHNFRRRVSRSRSRERNNLGQQHRRNQSGEQDLYRDLIFNDYQDESNNYGQRGAYDNRQNRGGNNRDEERDMRDMREMRDVRDIRDTRDNRDSPRDIRDDRHRPYWNDRQRDRDTDRDKNRKDYNSSRHGGNNGGNNGSSGGGNSSRRQNTDRDRDGYNSGDDSDEFSHPSQFYNKSPSNTIIVFGLQSHITEADIMSFLIRNNMAATSIRLIRKKITGASRGFAFVEFNTVEEAVRWMEISQGVLELSDHSRATLQYSHSRDQITKTKTNDWYCGKCGVYNFKRRGNCFKCYASREESERGGEGSDEISNILTKKIMLRNLDALTNEEGVLTVMQQFVPDLAKQINKIQISRDLLTQTSRGICYLNFETLVDSMNLHNALTAMEPPLKIDDREIIVSYCIDHENKQIVPKKSNDSASISMQSSSIIGPPTAAEMASSSLAGGQYSVADVSRLAEYSASVYASNPIEHAHYLQYYTEYYMTEITKGHFQNLPTEANLAQTSANSGAAVALHAIQQKQKKMNSIETTATQAAQAAAAAAKAALAAQLVAPRGNDGKVYPTPDVSLYQYDETSGYYYDPSTGLYYDAHSQYYYNNETGAYLYWDQRKSTYTLATPASAAAAVEEVVKAETGEDSTHKDADDDNKKDKKEGKHDKVKVAKKIVKDMEKWAKQLNQKKDYTVVATPQPILSGRGEEQPLSSRPGTSGGGFGNSGYADVGFSIMEKKERSKLSDFQIPSASIAAGNKLLTAYGSDSDDDHVAKSSTMANTKEPSENDYVDFQKLTCLLCKRAFQSLDILQKHLKMSNLHKENLQKYNLQKAEDTEMDSTAAALAYRDRAKERRLKYGESDPPPNRSRERFQNEMKSLASRQPAEAPPMPIGSNNVGNRLLQKMGWSEGQGLGRKNQGRTNIIEADARNTTAGLGNKSGLAPGDDYKSYIKKMMKSRYESA